MCGKFSTERFVEVKRAFVLLISLPIGIIIGFVLALAPGPMAMGAVNMGLEKGLKRAYLFAAGSGFMDIIFCTIAIITASALQSSVLKYIGDNPIFMLVFQVIVIGALVAFGIAVLNTSKKKIKTGNLGTNKFNRKLDHTKPIDWMKHHGAFWFGVAFATINIANPTFLPFLTFLNIQVHKFGLIADTFSSNFLYAVGFGFGNFLWIALLSRLVVKYRNNFGRNFVLRVNQFAGITFISFAGLIGIRLITMTKWADILKLAF